MMKNVTIIGAGASGLMAAVCAARAGARVTVLEHREEAGIKLSLTGNGRCNYTNTDIGPAHYHCSDPAFAESVLRNFGYQDAVRFFENLGIRPVIRHYDFDEFGYVYPEGMNAAGFRDAIFREAERLGVAFCFGLSDDEVMRRAEAVIDEIGRKQERDSALILAAGSNAYPVTGSDSSIYPLIRKLGLDFHTFLPALCGLYSKDPLLKEWKGRRVRGEAVLLISEGQDPAREYRASGEIQFTEHSISGIPVMQLSRYAAIALKKGQRAFLTIRTDEQHTFEIYRTAGFDRAQVCSGGIDIAEIDPASMQIKKHPGIYVCGEMIDVDGECGGFNLHFAWASGHLAGLSAAHS
ncbi:MAG: NAD(P)/FAD-dependent oxidoreductase [Lachnospiraceae bacterium]|nr:NAD(P)/FAD-dependent oxidoreductase [Lachnospiraceae bacterium]